MNGKEVGVMDLDKDVFDVEFKEDLIHQAVVTRLATSVRARRARSPAAKFAAAARNLGDRRVPATQGKAPQGLLNG